MPFRFINPEFAPVEDFDPAVHAPIRVSAATDLDGGIYAWVRLMARAGGELFATEEPKEFRVPIRDLLPGPTLGPRDREVMAWIDRHGWSKAVTALEERWIGRREDPKEYAAAQKRRRKRKALTVQLNAQDKAEKPKGFMEEFMDRFGRLIDDITKTAGTVGRIIKWSAIGVVAIGGGLLAVRAVKAVRQR